MDTQQSDRTLVRDKSDAINLNLALDAARTGAWQWNPATDILNCNRRMKTICGIASGAPPTLEAFLRNVRREDRIETRSMLLKIFREGASGSVECRLADGHARTDRWITLEGRSCVLRGAMHMLGTAREISVQKAEDAQRELAMRDMEHRIHNIFAVLTAVVSLSERTATTPAQLARALEARISALARAHTFLRAAQSGKEVALHQIAAGEIAPFTDTSTVSIRGPHIAFASREALAMNLIVHELATNAAKHGALSGAGGGKLSIEWSIESTSGVDCLVFHWKENCGREIVAPGASGLGLKLLSLCARTSLGGDISLQFEATGLHAKLVVPVPHLAHSAS